MKTSVVAAFQEFRYIFGICPCCRELFRLSDAYIHTKGRAPRTLFDRLSERRRRLEVAEEKLGAEEASLREAARARGLRRAKRSLKRIDPTFSGKGLDPQDVKVLFSPVEYVVFDGLNTERLRRVLFVDRAPESLDRERVQESLCSALHKGNIEWKTLRVSPTGGLEMD